MRLPAVTTVLLSIAVLVSGCMTYKVGGESFSSTTEALQRQAQIQAAIAAQITSAPTPVGGTALVLIPSDLEIQRNFLAYGDNSHKLGKESIDFLITSARNDFRFLADAIAKRHIFDSVSVASHNGNPAQFPAGESEFLVFVDVGGWFVKKGGQAKPVPVVDRSKPVGVLGFLDALYQQAGSLRSQ